eukprot:CAMPEP_0182473796 /NCGR_PEP_ID=MMETSP1319-20130603/24570_1 /TAXON_ID=172717 /ORGANISM="Bolidomonas pacifica, Strain RCC208" /LENGTH=421 /DNA_ID=CAMNT_0024674631 /DNA_START=110 /DNA_END=1372 /DNA_ORIENTATION=+
MSLPPSTPPGPSSPASTSLSSSRSPSSSSSLFSWFRSRISRTPDSDARISFRVATIGYQPDLQPLLSPTPPHPLIRVASADDTPGSPPPPHPSASKSRCLPVPTVRPGSLSSSVFNLCSATLGAGALSLPYAFSLAGLTASIFLLLLAAASTLLSIHLLIRSSHKCGCRSYEEMTVGLFGRQVGALVESSIIVFCFGTCVAYIVAVGDILDQNLLAALPKPEGWWGGLFNREGLMVVFTAGVMFPLSLNERINSLRYSSLFGICSIFFLVLSTTYHSLHSLYLNGYAATWSLTPHPYVGTWKGVVKACPIIMFAFTCQVNVFSIYDELSSRSRRKMDRVGRNAVALCVAAYAMMGTFGSLDFGEDTSPNVLQNYCVGKTHDPVMVVASVGIVVTIVMAFPLNVFPTRYTIEVIMARYAFGA